MFPNELAKQLTCPFRVLLNGPLKPSVTVDGWETSVSII